MSLNELTEFIGNLGASTRTGPITACPHCNCRKTQPQCRCSKNPVIASIHRINKAPSTERERKLYNLLRVQSQLLGLIMSRHNGKCIGVINNNGRITHCDAASAEGPYNIIIKPTTKDTIPYSSQGQCQGSGRPMCQCVDKTGKTVAEIVRKNKVNSIKLTDKSKAPVMAVILPMVNDPAPDTEKLPRVSLDDMIRESKAMIEARKN